MKTKSVLRMVFLTLFFSLSFKFFAMNAYSIDSLEVVWSTYIGGPDAPQGEISNDMILDAAGNLFIVGHTESPGLPNRTNEPGNGWWKTFVARIDSSGQNVWSTYISSDENTTGKAITMDSVGNLYVTGNALMSDLPKNLTPGSGQGIYITKLLASAGTIQWTRFLTSTYFENEGLDITTSSDGSIFTTGKARSDTLLSDVNNRSGDTDAFVSKIDAKGNVLWSKFIGGTRLEEGYSIFLDQKNHIYLAGRIFWEYYNEGDYDFPAAKNHYHGGYREGFVTKLDETGEYLWSLYLGGSNDEYCNEVTVDSSGHVFIVGDTWSQDFEPKPLNTSQCDQGDGFFVKSDSLGNPLWSRFVAKTWGVRANRAIITPCGNVLGLISLRGHGLATMDRISGQEYWYLNTDEFCSPNMEVSAFSRDRFGHYFITGSSNEQNFPKRNNNFFGGQSDAYIVKVMPKGFYFHFEHLHKWSFLPNQDEGWSISNGKLILKGKGGNVWRSSSFQESLCNCSFEVSTKTIAGARSASHGLFVRKSSAQSHFYRFRINANGQYAVERVIDENIFDLEKWVHSDKIHPGLNNCNYLKVVAKDSLLKFYVNGDSLATIKDTTNFCGKLGVFVEDNNPASHVVHFDEILISAASYFPTNIPEPMERGTTPEKFELLQNYPNPFNSATTIKFSLPEAGFTTLTIYNVLGKKVTTLVSKKLSAGVHQYRWNANNIGNGVYFYKLKTDGFVEIKKSILIK